MQKVCPKIIKHNREAQKSLREDPGIIVESSGEKCFSTILNHFRATYFSLLRNFAAPVLDIVNTQCDETKPGPINITEGRSQK